MKYHALFFIFEKAAKFVIGEKKISENDQLTGHLQSIFLISPEKTVKLIIKVNQQSVLNLYIYWRTLKRHHLLKC